MNVFLFQSVPDRFDMRKKLKPGVDDTWYATRYRNEMRSGDPVFFWMGGSSDIRGLYGWGHLTSEPHVKPSWDGHGVDVRYDVKFDHPILIDKILADPILANMLVVRAPQATNFLLSRDEVSSLLKLTATVGEKAPSIAEDER